MGKKTGAEQHHHQEQQQQQQQQQQRLNSQCFIPLLPSRPFFVLPFLELLLSFVTDVALVFPAFGSQRRPKPKTLWALLTQGSWPKHRKWLRDLLVSSFLCLSWFWQNQILRIHSVFAGTIRWPGWRET